MADASQPEPGPLARAAGRVVRIGARSPQYWGDLWQSRDLVGFLAWRDIAVRYKQTVVGLAWSVLRPVLVTAILVFVFGRVGRFTSSGVPYPMLVFVAITPWFLFSNAFQDVCNSLVGNAPLVAKVYFPRLILPASAVVINVLDFLVAIVLLGLLMVWYGLHPTWRLLLLPPFALLTVLVALGPGLLVASLYVHYRDFRFIVPLTAQVGLYLSPVGYDSSLVPAGLRPYYSLNPMVGVIEGFRWSILGIEPSWTAIALAVPVALLFLVLGLGIFRRAERLFADWL